MRCVNARPATEARAAPLGVRQFESQRCRPRHPRNLAEGPAKWGEVRQPAPDLSHVREGDFPANGRVESHFALSECFSESATLDEHNGETYTGVTWLAQTPQAKN